MIHFLFTILLFKLVASSFYKNVADLYNEQGKQHFSSAVGAYCKPSSTLQPKVTAGYYLTGQGFANVSEHLSPRQQPGFGFNKVKSKSEYSMYCM